MTKYFLNNFSKEETVQINLTAQRTIEPLKSLPLNDKDIEIFKNLKKKAGGRPSLLDNIVLSTIRIEEDSRYTETKEVITKQVPKDLPEKCKPCYADDKVPTEKDCVECKAKEAAEQEAKEKAEQEAKKKEGQNK